MATTVRVRDEDKRLLDRMQAEWTLQEGRRPSLDEVLHRALAAAREHARDCRHRPGYPRVDAEERRRLLSLTFSTPGATGEETIDDAIYGPEA